MSYIEPNSTIRILHDIPLDSTYHDTIYWDNEPAQNAYFYGKTKYTFTKGTYQRVNRNTMRLGIKADSLYDCDYLMFQNTSFGNKWFYAFINEVNYINNVTCEVVYQIDEIQSWFFDFKADECYIARQHTETDVIGEHIEPEPVPLGEYVYNKSGNDDPLYGDYGVIMDASTLAVIVAIVDVANDGATSSDGQLYDGIYGGATLYAYLATDVTGINSLLNEYTEKPDAIVGMYTIPLVLCYNFSVPTGGSSESHKVPVGTKGATFNKRITINPSFIPATGSPTGTTGLLDGYSPKNNKMYTYPYNFYNIDNANGDTLPLRYEFFQDGVPDLLINGTITQPAQMVLRPRNYKGSGNRANNTETISISNFPMCSWNMDAYQAWVAQNSVPIMLNLGSTVAQGALGMISSAVGIGQGTAKQAQSQENSVAQAGIGMISNVVGEAISALSANYTASISADISRGRINNGGANVSAGKNNFYGGRMSVNKCNAKMIDNFFSMYGYALNIIGIPNRKARPHFTYTKTVGCTIHGSIPNTALNTISAIYNNGITWWKNPDEVGDYKLDNAPT